MLSQPGTRPLSGEKGRITDRGNLFEANLLPLAYSVFRTRLYGENLSLKRCDLLKHLAIKNCEKTFRKDIKEIVKQV